MEFITLGAAPLEESCAQVGRVDYEARSWIECRVFKRQLARTHPIPDGIKAVYCVRLFPHDFGTYREVVVSYDDTSAAATALALKVEHETPLKWDERALAELAWFELRATYAAAIRRGDIAEERVPVLFRTASPPDGLTMAAIAQRFADPSAARAAA